MVRENQTIVRMNGWPGGLNTEDDTILLQIDESPEVSNMDFGFRGEVVRRQGFNKWSTSDPAGMGEGLHLFSFNPSEVDDHDYLIYVDASGDVWDLQATSEETFAQSQYSGPTDVTVSVNLVGHAVFGGFFYLTSPAGGKINKWDGTTWTNISDNTLNGSGTEFPLALNLAVHADRMWATLGESSKLHFSNAGDADTWEANDFILVQPHKHQNRALRVFQNTLLIFKDHSVSQLAGTSPDSFTLTTLTSQYGTQYDKTIVDFADRIMWFDDRYGVISFDGSGTTFIDDKVNKLILADAPGQSFAQQAAAFNYEQKYYLSFNRIPSTYVYDLRTESWAKYDYGVTDTVFRGQELVQALATNATENAKGVWTMYDSDGAGALDDDDTLITSSFKTPWFGPEPDGSFVNTHRLLKMIPQFTPATGPTPVNVTIDLYTNFNNNTVVESITQKVDESNSDQVDPILVEFENHTARAFQIKFTHATAAENWQLNAIDFLFLTKPTVSGVR